MRLINSYLPFCGSGDSDSDYRMGSLRTPNGGVPAALLNTLPGPVGFTVMMANFFGQRRGKFKQPIFSGKELDLYKVTDARAAWLGAGLLGIIRYFNFEFKKSMLMIFAMYAFQ